MSEVAAVDPVYLTGAEKREALLELTAAIAALEEVRLRVLAAGQAMGDVADQDGSRDAAAWLGQHARLDPGRARHLGRLATSLDVRWHLVAAGLREGRLDLPQAAVIVSALDDLPDDVPDDVVAMAEAELVAQGAHFDPRRLRILGRRVLDVVAPQVHEDLERRALEDQDAHARRVTYLRTRCRGDGTTDLRARLADDVAARLLTYLHAFTSPRQPGRDDPDDPTAPPDRRPHDEQLGHALGAFLETIDPHRLPLHGGDATTIVVTIDHTTLTRQLEGAGAAGGVALVGDQPLTAGQARRLACTARILPAVLGGTSEVLDLGRARRLFSPAQRKALALRHPHCAAHGCDIPAPWCEAHHTHPWSHGGQTDLAHGVLLCSHHHHRAHDPRYDTRRHLDGSIRFHRRT